MINFIWFTRTENFYAELDALFYFFLTACLNLAQAWVWRQSCARWPGLPWFLTYSKEIPYSSQTHSFPPLFHFKGFGEIVFQSSFLVELGWAGCFCFPADKKEQW